MTYPPSATTPVSMVRGIGSRRGQVLESIGVTTVYDLLLYVPRRYLDRSAVVTISHLRRLALGPRSDDGSAERRVRLEYTVVGEVRSYRTVGYGRKARFVLVLGDPSGSMQCVWFGGVPYWKNAFHIGQVLAVSGEPSMYGPAVQFIHPEIDRLGSRRAEEPDARGTLPDWALTLNTGGLVPLYPSGQKLAHVGLDSAGFRRAIHAALESHLSRIPDVIPPSLTARNGLQDIHSAIRSVHFPPDMSSLSPALRRLRYEELFLFQIRLALRRRRQREAADGMAFTVKSSRARRLVDSLPFPLTAAQRRVLREIAADMEQPRAMNRLLQGDVGSGKTIVALAAMLIAVDNDVQAVMMAPTEILAEQHARTIVARLGGLDVGIRLLVGAQRSKARREVLADIASGSAQIVVGTHALFEKGVTFSRLGLVVIDEQHRFGVEQRAMLRSKGSNPDVLVMTATPIPRTLSMTIYGDLDVSTIDEMPPGRKPIRTLLRSDDDPDTVHDFVRSEVRKGRQAYFVYPLIEESEAIDLKAAAVHERHLAREVFPDLRVGLLHGRMPPEEKEAVMRRFQRGETDILAATTVIEVGIDVPNATVMVIENAERFGLSQLHQLRGRIGRGEGESTCILVASAWAINTARRTLPLGLPSAVQDDRHAAAQRLATMAETTDGFRIAEVDLALRGPGDYFGTRQSGLPAFRVADLLRDGDVLRTARQDAFEIIERDPHLREPEHRQLREFIQHSEAVSHLSQA